MKKAVLTGLAVAVLLCAAALQAEEQKGPRIVTKEAQFNLGKVTEGTKASHIFEVTNAGSEELVIDRVVPS